MFTLNYTNLDELMIEEGIDLLFIEFSYDVKNSEFFKDLVNINFWIFFLRHSGQE